jgi:signal transduction histidine kinase
VDLGELCQELAKGAPDGVVKVECAAGTPHVMGHYEPLRRAMQNLLINAIDAVKQKGGRVKLAVRARPNGSAPAVEVLVTDSGVGIAPENLSRVFEPHFTTKAGGTGLGLAIVRQTIRHHGGTITVASEPGKGSTFTVTLPGSPA